MKVGCVKEIKQYEYRVGMTPDNVREYIAQGHEVFLEKGAGEGSGFRDEAYAEAGAVLLQDPAEIWNCSDMIIKVKEPLEQEFGLMRKGQIIYAYLHLAADKVLTETLLAKEVRAVAYETIRDRDGGLPLLRPMSEVAGRLSIQEGAKSLEKQSGGMGVLLSGVPGTPRGHVVILGGGVVGLNACKIALGIGARVTVMDNNLQRLSSLDDLFGQSIQTLYSTPTAIEAALADADLVIGAVLVPGAAAPKLIRRSYLKHMKPGSVIVDVAVDQGGCCETSRPTYHDNPTYIVDDVIHYCVGNMPGAVSCTSTIALTNATLSFGLQMAGLGLEEALRRDEDNLLAPGVNCYLGALTYRGVADSLALPWTPLEKALQV